MELLGDELDEPTGTSTGSVATNVPTKRTGVSCTAKPSRL
jgi:hypothetical protein